MTDDPRNGQSVERAAIPEGWSVPNADPDKPSAARSAVSWLITIGIALAVVLIVQIFLVKVYSIPSASMVHTLEVGDRVIVSKLSTDPGRGDIVVFNRPPNDPASSPDDPEVLIKRVIGLPGETVDSREGKVYVDGRLLNEDYLAEGTFTQIDAPIKIPAGHILVLGDNRQVSKDGRFFGPIAKTLVVGRAVLRIWPLGRAGSL